MNERLDDGAAQAPFVTETERVMSTSDVDSGSNFSRVASRCIRIATFPFPAFFWL